MDFDSSPQPAHPSQKPQHVASTWPLWLFLLLFFLLSLGYHYAVPLGEGPDEPGHFAYVLHLACEGRLPVQDDTHSDRAIAGEAHQPPLAYLLALPSTLWLPNATNATDAYCRLPMRANPTFVWSGGDEPNAFVRGSGEYFPWPPTLLSWHIARGFSTLLGGITVVCVYGAAAAMRGALRPTTVSLLAPPSHPSPLIIPIATLIVALNPQVLFTSVLVTNDSLLLALSAATLWLAIATPPHSNAPIRHAIALGGLIGLALLTKLSAVVLLPVGVWASWRAANGSLRVAIRHGLLWMAVVLLVAGWWYVRNWLLYGDPLGFSTFHATFATQPFQWRDPVAWLAALNQFHRSLWGSFGWLTVNPPQWVIWCYSIVEIAAVVGLITRLWHRSRHQALLTKSASLSASLSSPWVGVILLIVVTFAWVVSFAVVAGLVAWQGRLFFPALPAYALLLGYGLTSLRIGVGKTAVRIGAVGMVVLAGWLPFYTIAPAYEWHTLPAEAARERIAIPTYARFAKEWEQGAVLRGVTIESTIESTIDPIIDPIIEPKNDVLSALTTGATTPTTHPMTRMTGSTTPMTVAVRAGDPFTATLFWHALEPLPKEWTVFLHVVNEAGEIVAEDNREPQDGAFPMGRWTAGDWIEDPHPLTLPADTPPGRYALRVGWYRPWTRDPRKGNRQRVWDEQGTLVGDYATVTILLVAASR